MDASGLKSEGHELSASLDFSCSSGDSKGIMQVSMICRNRPDSYRFNQWISRAASSVESPLPWHCGHLYSSGCCIPSGATNVYDTTLELSDLKGSCAVTINDDGQTTIYGYHHDNSIQGYAGRSLASNSYFQNNASLLRLRIGQYAGITSAHTNYFIVDFAENLRVYDDTQIEFTMKYTSAGAICEREPYINLIDRNGNVVYSNFDWK